MAAKVTASRHWAHISEKGYDIPARALLPEDLAARPKTKDQFRDTEMSRERRGYARQYMQGKGVAFLAGGLGTSEVTTLRSITPVNIKKEHDRARAHTPSQIIPGLRTDVNGELFAARPITNSALEFRERRRKGEFGIGHVGKLRGDANAAVEKTYPTYGRIYGEYIDGNKTPAEWPEKTKIIPRPLTTGVPSFPTGRTNLEVGGIAGCPDAIKFLQSINPRGDSRSGDRGGSGGGGGGG
eukprot:CAMPEP_0197599034 /NCGR_PEP_ID=MMETSP1326-20131121/30530_1 /TAXON_ID=1155430 /ORGANISM="Genus nov. species nov., Strain RCC2288" /LENGTH=239 /DNA_ID=CAMNT_0043165927 /DNA_START=190 /DNA_END=906 /DNA_ORIENTATION=-